MSASNTYRSSPEVASSQCKFRYGRGRAQEGKEKVHREIAKWNPLRPLLIFTGRDKGFLPVLHIEIYRDRAFKAAKKGHLTSIFIAVVGLIVSLIIWALNNDEKALILSTATLCIFLYLYLDYMLVIRNFQRVLERSDFVLSIYDSARKSLPIWVALMVSFGVIQCCLQFYFIGIEPVIYKFGLIYAYSLNENWWRLITGPYFHASVAHWIVNLLFLVIFSPVADFVSRKGALAAFVFGNFLAAAMAKCTNDFGLSGGDAYVGISGGIYAFWGWIILSAIFYRDKFPSFFYISFSLFSILNFVLTVLLAPNASNIGHFGGFLGGLIVFFVFYFSRRHDNWSISK